MLDEGCPVCQGRLKHYRHSPSAVKSVCDMQCTVCKAYTIITRQYYPQRLIVETYGIV